MGTVPMGRPNRNLPAARDLIPAGTPALRRQQQVERANQNRAQSTVTVRTGRIRDYPAARSLVGFPDVALLKISPVFASDHGGDLAGIVLADQDLIVSIGAPGAREFWSDDATLRSMDEDDWKFLNVVQQGSPTPDPLVIPTRLSTRPRNLAYYPGVAAAAASRDDLLGVLQRWTQAIELVKEGQELIESLSSASGGMKAYLDLRRSTAPDRTSDDVLRARSAPLLHEWSSAAGAIVEASLQAHAGATSRWVAMPPDPPPTQRPAYIHWLEVLQKNVVHENVSALWT